MTETMEQFLKDSMVLDRLKRRLLFRKQEFTDWKGAAKQDFLDLLELARRQLGNQLWYHLRFTLILERVMNLHTNGQGFGHKLHDQDLCQHEPLMFYPAYRDGQCFWELKHEHQMYAISFSDDSSVLSHGLQVCKKCKAVYFTEKTQRLVSTGQS